MSAAELERARGIAVSLEQELAVAEENVRRLRFAEMIADNEIEEQRAERIHWEAEHAALFGAIWKLAKATPGATGRALHAIIDGTPWPADDEEFCSRCFAGITSSEHHERCGPDA